MVVMVAPFLVIPGVGGGLGGWAAGHAGQRSLAAFGMTKALRSYNERMRERGAASSERFRRILIPVLLAAAGALVAGFGFFFFRDNFATHYPFKVVSAAAWRAGSIPWWNPTDGGGQPLAGNPNTLTFYPDNILYLLLPAHVAFNLHFLLHLLLGWFPIRALIQSHSPSPRRSGEKVPLSAAKGRMRGVATGAPSFGATLWVLSGAAISALAFYNLVTAVALI